MASRLVDELRAGLEAITPHVAGHVGDRARAAVHGHAVRRGAHPLVGEAAGAVAGALFAWGIHAIGRRLTSGPASSEPPAEPPTAA